MAHEILLTEVPLHEILKLIPRIGQAFSNSATYTFKVDKKTYSVKLYTETLKVIAVNPVCANCGIKASVARFYKQNNDVFVNIYAVDEKHRYIRMTKDHIVPVMRGGADSFKNYQAMCAKCNGLKSGHYFSFASDWWYIRWADCGWAEGPFKLPFVTKSESEVRRYIRKKYNYKKLPAGMECFPSKGYHLIF